jgi:phage/plasmid-associated DNA primase
MSVKIKYAKKDISTRLQVRAIIGTNQALKLPDSADAVLARALALEGHKSWLGNEDEDLADKLAKTAPAILNWARQGLIDLRTRNANGSRRKFVQPKCGLPVINSMKKLSNHIGVFADEQLVFGAEERVYVDALYDIYCKWCRAQGIRPANKVWFGIQAHDLNHEIGDGFDQRNRGRLHYYIGVRYRVPEEGGLFPPMLNDLPLSSDYLPTSPRSEAMREEARLNAFREDD